MLHRCEGDPRLVRLHVDEFAASAVAARDAVLNMVDECAHWLIDEFKTEKAAVDVAIAHYNKSMTA